MSNEETQSPPTAIEPAAQSPRRSRGEPELARGASLGRYMVIERLGAGGMGVVFSAFDPELGRKVALKLVTGGDQERMLREAQALARLAHPNVVAVHDVGKHDERVFVAMELVDGGTLSAWLRARPRTWREIVAMFGAAGRGLAAAHAAGIVHRDFKPANVLVGKDGRARVLDFGLARAAGEPPEPVAVATTGSRDVLGEDLTATGSVLGTPVYMPPEAFRGELVGAAGDQFSFCVALYEALYGERPFERPWKDEHDPPALRAAPATTSVPAWLRKVVVRGLAERADDRYPSMLALLAALEADPAKQWRTRAFAFTAALALAGIVAAAVMWRAHGSEHAADPCDVTAPFAGIWDQVTRARVHTAFTAAGGADAAAELVRTDAALDEATARWLDARAKVCAQPRSERGPSDRALLLQLACFDQQKDELASLVDLFEQADASIVKQASRAVRQLPGPSACISARSLSLVDPPTTSQRATVTELRKQLARTAALRATSKQQDALTAMPALVERARAIAYPPVLAEVLYQYATLRMSSADYDVSALLDECERIAAASHMDVLAARAAARRYSAGAIAGQDPALVREWREHARTWIEREHDLEAEYHYAAAASFETANAGDYTSAVANVRREIEIANQLWGPDAIQVTTARGNLAFQLTAIGQYDEAIAIFKDLVGTLERTYGETSHELSLQLDNLGMVLAMTGHYSEALPFLQRAMQARSTAVRGAALCDSSRALLGLGKTEEAIDACTRGLALIREVIKGGVNLASNMDPLAAAYLAGHHYADALAHARDCLAEFRKGRTQDQVDEVACLAVEGTALLELGKPREAVDVLDHALAVQASVPAAPGVVANLRYQLARALVASDGDRARAQELVSRAREELVKYPFEQSLLDALEAWRIKVKLR